MKEETIDLLKVKGQVIHISVRTFIPKREGIEREVDIGLIINENPVNFAFCKTLKKQIQRHIPDFRIKFNEPFGCRDNDLITELDSHFGDKYVGIQLEINQRLILDKHDLEHQKKSLSMVLADTVQAWQLHNNTGQIKKN